MVRGTFANIRLRNELVPGVEGGFTAHLPDGERTTIFEASERYRAEGVALIVIAGKEYGSGSSRDWAAKGTQLLGVRAVIAESFERIHRSNLVGMGVLPLEFTDGETRKSLELTGQRELLDRRARGGRYAAPEAQGAGQRWRPHTRVRGARADRHARGSRVHASRRHPAVRAARTAPRLGALAATPGSSRRIRATSRRDRWRSSSIRNAARRSD